MYVCILGSSSLSANQHSRGGQETYNREYMLMLCVVTLYISGGANTFKEDFLNDRFFGKLYNDSFLYSQSFRRKSAERKSPKKYFFEFRYVRDVSSGL